MIQKLIEIESAPLTANELVNLHVQSKRRLIEDMRRQILENAGEGPYPKFVNVERYRADYDIRKIAKQLKGQWPEMRCVTIKCVFRNWKPLTRDRDESMKGLLSALQWCGWAVSDKSEWITWYITDQIVGAPKSIIDVYIPENPDDELRLTEGRKNGNKAR